MKPMAGGTVLAPVTIEETPKLMLVDTGGFTSQLWESTARSFNLPERDGGVGLTDVNGNVSSKLVRVAEFRLGSLENRNLDFQIFPDAAVNLGDDEIAGLIAPNLFIGYDMDLDFGTNTLNTFSQDHCAGEIQYWSAPAAAVIPFTLQSGHISIPVTIDGHRLNAIIDTGTSTTTMTANAASAIFGFSPDMPNLRAMTGGNQPVIYSHVFSNLLFDGVSVGNPHINVMPDMTGKAANGTLPDVIIGMDVLRQLHVYIAFQEQRIYVSKLNPAKVI
jgi:predicted aspartyl protease